MQTTHDLIIQPADATTLHRINQCDNAFRVETALVLESKNNQICYTTVPVEPYLKRYPPEEVDYLTYLDREDRVIFFASLEGQLAGQIILRKYWNGFAYIDDITVDARFRRMGIGTALLAQAVNWAKSKNLPGIMLETQNNNLAACKLYERFGFQLAGFDRLLYKAIEPATEEIALYWYLLF